MKLLDRVISMASDAGSVVFDPFGGSGTTYVVAELLGRRWVGVELDCADIVARFRDPIEDRKHLEKIASEKNVLFKREALQLRARNGYTTDRYRLSHETSADKSPQDVP